MSEEPKIISTFSAQAKSNPHFSTKDFKWSGISRWWACEGIPAACFLKIKSSLVWNREFRSVSKGSFNNWSSFSSNRIKSLSSLLTLNGESKYETSFFFDEETGVWLGEPLKNFTFELGKEKIEYLKCGWIVLEELTCLEKNGLEDGHNLILKDRDFDLKWTLPLWISFYPPSTYFF